MVARSVPHGAGAAGAAARSAASGAGDLPWAPAGRDLRHRPGRARAPLRHRPSHDAVCDAAGGLRGAGVASERPGRLRRRHPDGRASAGGRAAPHRALRQLHRRAGRRGSGAAVCVARRRRDLAGARPERPPGLHLPQPVARAAPSALAVARPARHREFHARAVVCGGDLRRAAGHRAVGAARDDAPRSARERDGDPGRARRRGRLQRRHPRRGHRARLARGAPHLPGVGPGDAVAAGRYPAARAGRRPRASHGGPDTARTLLRSVDAAGAALRGAGRRHPGRAGHDLRRSHLVGTPN